MTEISFIDGFGHVGYGLGQALDQLRDIGLAPSEAAVDLALLAAAITAADTRISRDADAQDAWTREIDLHLPVHNPALWAGLAALIVTTLNFLTGDHWSVRFRPRIASVPTLATAPTKLRTATPSSVCLFSGGLDSFIGAIDLLAAGEFPLLVSHYWDGITSKHQTYCGEALKRRFPGATIHHVRARVGFPNDVVDDFSVENTLRGRSFLFFALAALAADAIGGQAVVHVPENGLISLNVPLDPLRLGALSTRTTHPFYMARFEELLRGLGLSVTLHNPYAFQTKGQMAKGCADVGFLSQEAKNTMSCSSPANARYAKNKSDRQPKHCGYCVPCLIRRAAILEGWGIDDTEYQVADLHSRPLDTRRAEGGHVRSFQLALSRLAKKPARAALDIHRPGPLTDHPSKLGQYEAVYIAGLREVGRLLEGVQAKPS
ncbi:Qat anti-phage system QueC-like protein QatC [uncultured Sphingomonas sp.]|uniref:Qat anti-phage system QueC-like protein QatC n=1 Tax=uncultured Sphingomonas sp. TaxID=158754 RepID=UPI0025EF8286|nr:Qat anti-phage system QueC-like protein QatC [uncultured Sphingomonas sp.]